MVSKTKKCLTNDVFKKYILNFVDFLEYHSIKIESAIYDRTNIDLAKCNIKQDYPDGIKQIEEILDDLTDLLDYLFTSISQGTDDYFAESFDEGDPMEANYDGFEKKTFLFSSLLEALILETIDFHRLKRKHLRDLSRQYINGYFLQINEFLLNFIIITKRSIRRLRSTYLIPLESEFEQKKSDNALAHEFFNESLQYHTHAHISKTIAYRKILEICNSKIEEVENTYSESMSLLKLLSIKEPNDSDVREALEIYLKNSKNSYKLCGPYSKGEDFVISDLRLSSSKIESMIKDTFEEFKDDKDKGYLSLRCYLYIRDDESLESASEQLNMPHQQDKVRRNSKCVIPLIAKKVLEEIYTVSNK